MPNIRLAMSYRFFPCTMPLPCSSVKLGFCIVKEESFAFAKIWFSFEQLLDYWNWNNLYLLGAIHMEANCWYQFIWNSCPWKVAPVCFFLFSLIINHVEIDLYCLKDAGVVITIVFRLYLYYVVGIGVELMPIIH